MALFLSKVDPSNIATWQPCGNVKTLEFPEDSCKVAKIATYFSHLLAYLSDHSFLSRTAKALGIRTPQNDLALRAINFELPSQEKPAGHRRTKQKSVFENRSKTGHRSTRDSVSCRPPQSTIITN
jgi:hypothetical protein